MNNIASIRKKIMLLAALLPATLLTTAQETAQASATKTEGSNLLAILLTVVAIVLAFIIWGMGQALVSISRLALDKQKNIAKTLVAGFVIAFLFITQNAAAQNAVEAAVKSEPNYGGLTAHDFYGFVSVILIEIIAVFFLAFNIRSVYRDLAPEKAVVKKSRFKEWWNTMDKKFFTKAVPVEKEADAMLDHDYDGIHELDNALPPWWKYGFYVTICVAIFYLGYFHAFGEGKNPTQEYEAEMHKASIEKERYEANNKDKIDESNVPMADASGIAEGKDLFTAKCWACHGKAGEGGAGPNLTDDYWIHKGSLNDIYHSIKVGYQDKGMQEWAKEFTPKQMANIAGFIKTLHGTNPPNAKAPQGDLFSENKVDSTTTAIADSSASATIAK